MNVTIIGNGKMAHGIGTRLVSGGHKVTIHAKDEAKGQELAEALGGGASAAAVGSETDNLVVLAVPYSEIENVAKEYSGWDGKTVVDITNPVDWSTMRLSTEPGTSGAEEVAKLLSGAKVVKAFNTIFNKTLEAGQVDGQSLDVLIAGDDQGAKDTLKELVETSGMRGLDVGPLSHARHLEGLGLIHMTLQDQLGTGWASAVKFIG